MKNVWYIQMVSTTMSYFEFIENLLIIRLMGEVKAREASPFQPSASSALVLNLCCPHHTSAQIAHWMWSDNFLSTIHCRLLFSLPLCTFQPKTVFSGRNSRWGQVWGFQQDTKLGLFCFSCLLIYGRYWIDKIVICLFLDCVCLSVCLHSNNV